MQTTRDPSRDVQSGKPSMACPGGILCPPSRPMPNCTWPEMANGPG